MNGENSAGAAGQGSVSMAVGSPVKNRVLAVLLLTFCCWHAMFLIVSIVPHRLGPDKSGNPVMEHYRLLTGGRQEWNMFETIPLLHSLDARLEVENETRGKTTVGCVLPGIAPYPQPEMSRYYILLHRLLLNSSRPSFMQAYMRRVEDLLSARLGSGVIGHWSLVIDAEYTRILIHSRRDGVLTVPATRSFTPADVGGNSP